MPQTQATKRLETLPAAAAIVIALVVVVSLIGAMAWFLGAAPRVDPDTAGAALATSREQFGELFHTVFWIALAAGFALMAGRTAYGLWNPQARQRRLAAPFLAGVACVLIAAMVHVLPIVTDAFMTR